MEIDTAADDAASTDTTDTSADSGGEAVESTSAANDNATGETAAEKRIRLKWLDREEELDDPRALADRFSDEYEFEFKGPGGKPLKQRWPDIERAVQLHGGAQESMKRYNQARQQLGAQIERGRANGHENLLDVVEEMFGVEDGMQWVEKIYAKHYEQQAHLANIAAAMAQDPHNEQLKWQYNQQLMAMNNAKLGRRQQWAERQRKAQEEQQQRHAKAQEEDRTIRSALQGVGVDINEHTIARAYWIKRKHEEAMGTDVPLEPRQLAAQLRKDLDKEWDRYFDSQPPEKLLSRLGEQRRAKLREAELAATKAAKKAQNAAPAASNGAKKPDSGGDAFEKAIRNMQRGA